MSWRTFLPWAIAAGLAVVAGLLAQRQLVLQSELALLRDQQALAEIGRQSVQQQLEAERIIHQRRLQDAGLASRSASQVDSITENPSRRDISAGLAIVTREIRAQPEFAALPIASFQPSKDAPDALAAAAWNPDQRKGVLNVAHLPALSTDEVYQLWVRDAQYPDPVDAGVFTVDAVSGKAWFPFNPARHLTSVQTFLITRERRGGARQPSGPVVLRGE